MTALRAHRQRMARWKYERAAAMRERPTKAEAALWDRLRGNVLGCRVKQQAPMLGYIADLYCPQARLVIEVDGPIHQQQRIKDAYRDSVFEDHGYAVLRFTNDRVLTDTDRVVSEIEAFIIANTVPA